MNLQNAISILSSRLDLNRWVSVSKNDSNENIFSNQFFNMRIKLFLFFSVMVLAANFSFAQNLTASVNITSDLEYFNDLSMVETLTTDYGKIEEDQYYKIPAQVSKFDSRTKAFYISSEGSKYSKAEILEVTTNKTLKEVDLQVSKRKVDMSDIPSGSYYLILTNDSGAVHSEQIVIL